MSVIPKDQPIQPDLYASTIINQARIVIERTKEIESYNPRLDNSVKEAKDIYLEEAQNVSSPRAFRIPPWILEFIHL